MIFILSNMSKTGVRWYFNFTKWSPSYQDILLATSCIQTEEKARIAKFVFQKDFKSSLIGRLLMRKFVAETANKNYDELIFSRDQNGRPICENVAVNFNVSHQGDYTVLAGELDNHLLGVDVMKLEYTGGKPLPEFFRIMSRNFSTPEWKTIYSFKTEREQLNAFCRLWSLKESYVKAIGVGITIRLDDLSFKISTPLAKGVLVDDTELYIRGQKQNGWYFQESLIDDSHCVAVASNKKVEGKVFNEVSFDFLVENAKPLLPEDVDYALDYFKKIEKT